MSVNNQSQSVYALKQPLVGVFPAPIVSLRSPTTADKAPIGQLWINKALNLTFVLTSITSNSANWQGAPQGAGIFATVEATAGNITADAGDIVATLGNITAGAAITAGTGLTVTAGGVQVTGTSAINTVGAATTSIGSVTGASGIALLVGTGNFSLDGVTNSTYIIGDSTTTGTITIGGNAQTGNFILAPSTAAGTVNLANANGAKTINIGNGVSGNTINIGNGVNTSAQAINIAGGNAGANSTVSILSGAATAGTSTLNLATGNSTKSINIGTGTGVKTVHFADGAAANVVTIGSTTGAAATTIQAGSLGLTLNAGGLILLDPQTDTQASPSAASTINANVGRVIFTGFTTASPGAQVFTITNNTVAVTSGIFCTVASLNASGNGASLRIEGIIQGAGTFDVAVSNNGLGALGAGDNVIITFWVIS